MRRTVILALGLALLPAMQPARASVTSLEPEIQDIFGDANGTISSRELSTYPASYSPADLVSVDFQTGYLAVPVGEDGIDHQPTELRIVIKTFASPSDLAPGSQLLFEVSSDFVTFDGTVSRTATGEVSSVARLRYRDDNCADASPCWTRSKPTWTAVIDPAQRTLTLTYPFSSLAADELGLIGPGEIMHPEATVGPPRADSSRGYLGRVDIVDFGDVFVVGEDVPDDVNCSDECETVRFPCAYSLLLGTGGGYVDFRASGLGLCFQEDPERTDLTLSIKRCESSGCTNTTTQKSCAGPKCGSKLAAPDSYVPNANYETKARWEYGDGRSFSVTIRLCPSTGPECPEKAEKQVSFYSYPP